MKLIPIQEAYARLFERQASVPGLELHANGHCAHIGKLSPGCLKCFVPDEFYANIAAALSAGRPAPCQADCPYCPDDRGFRDLLSLSQWDDAPWRLPEPTLQWLEDRFLQKLDHSTIPALSFSGGGEPLLQLDLIATYMEHIREELEPRASRRPWYFLYTNGLAMTERVARRCRDLGLDEVRFHLGASDFSERAYEGLEIAAQHIDTVSVETPAWPPHREKLFEMLPRIEALGVQHLNLGQVELNPHNREGLLQAYPEARFYQVLAYQLDDGGLVYDLMREVVERGYSYSVLDCSGLVKAVQRGRDYGVWARDIAHDARGLEELVDFDAWRRKQPRGEGS